MSEGSLQLLTLQHMLLLCLSSCLTRSFSLPVQLRQPAVQTSSVPTRLHICLCRLHICLCRLHGCTVTLRVGSGRLSLRGGNTHPPQQNVRGLLSLYSKPSHLHCKLKESCSSSLPAAGGEKSQEGLKEEGRKQGRSVCSDVGARVTDRRFVFSGGS